MKSLGSFEKLSIAVDKLKYEIWYAIEDFMWVRFRFQGKWPHTITGHIWNYCYEKRLDYEYKFEK